MKLGIPIYEGVNLLDVAGPLENVLLGGSGQRSSAESGFHRWAGGHVVEWRLFQT